LTDRVKYAVLQRVKERNNLPTINAGMLSGWSGFA
jgi:hypothetical protein